MTTLRYGQTRVPVTTNGPARPPCFGKKYNAMLTECLYQCPHRHACSAQYHGHGTVAPAKAAVESIGDPFAEALPEIQEHSAPDESFWAKLGYNSLLQMVTGLFHEVLYAVRSVPRKRYFDKEK